VNGGISNIHETISALKQTNVIVKQGEKNIYVTNVLYTVRIFIMLSYIVPPDMRKSHTNTISKTI